MFFLCSGNHERDWPGTGSFYGSMDSGGECGVLAETMFYVPTENRAKFWYESLCEPYVSCMNKHVIIQLINILGCYMFSPFISFICCLVNLAQYTQCL